MDQSPQERAMANLVQGEAYDQAVSSIVQMGFEKPLVERAMAVSYNNPERAVEYLLNGIPETHVGDGDNIFSLNADDYSSDDEDSNASASAPTSTETADAAEGQGQDGKAKPTGSPDRNTSH